MTSINLSDKKVNTFSAIFKDVFKRNLPGYIILNIIAALYIFSVSLIITDFHFRGIKLDYNYFYDITYDYTMCLSAGMAILTAAAGFVLAIKQFREIFSRQSSDFYFSMPVKRSTYINANMFYGAVCIFSAFFTAVVFSAVLTKTPLVFAIEYYGMNLPFLIQTAVNTFCAVMVCYALFVLCVVASGKIWQVFLFSTAAIISSFAGAAGIAAYLNKIYGFTVNSVYVSAVSPIGNVAASAVSNSALKFIFMFVSAAEFSIIFFCCQKVFAKRKAEAAENIPIGKFVPVLMIVFWQFAAFAMGTAFDVDIVLCIFIGVVFTFVSTVIFTALIYKKMLVKHTAFSFISVSVLGAVFSAAVVFVPQFVGYTEYVPDQNDIEYVSVNGFDDYHYSSANGIEKYADDFSDLFNNLSGEDYNYGGIDYRLEEEASVSKLVSLHKKMLDEDVMNSQVDNEDDYYLSVRQAVNIEYHLKNGKTVKRNYYVDYRSVSNEVAALLQTDEALDYQEPFNIDKSDIMFVDFLNYDDPETYIYEDDDVTSPDYYDGAYMTLDDYGELFSALKQDRMSEPVNVFIFNSSLPVDYDYSYSAEHSFDIYIYSMNEYTTEADREYFVSHSPQEILAYGYRVSEKEYRDFPYDETVVTIDLRYDKNTFEYLKSIGVDIG